MNTVVRAASTYTRTALSATGWRCARFERADVRVRKGSDMAKGTERRLRKVEARLEYEILGDKETGFRS